MTGCWEHNGNLRPDISQVAKRLSEITISDTNVRYEALQSQAYNVTDEIVSTKLEKSVMYVVFYFYMFLNLLIKTFVNYKIL